MARVNEDLHYEMVRSLIVGIDEPLLTELQHDKGARKATRAAGIASGAVDQGRGQEKCQYEAFPQESVGLERLRDLSHIYQPRPIWPQS
jgi:hypothetical protein